MTTTAQEYFEQGNTFFDERDFENANLCYSKVVNLVPNFYEAYYKRGLCYCKFKEYEMAIADFSKVIELDYSNEEAYWQRAEVYANLGKYNKVIEDYTTLIELNPYNTEFYYSRASYYKKSNKYGNAIKDYARIIALDPTNPQSFINRANCYEKMGEYQKAINDFTKSIELDPNNRQSYLCIVDCYIKLGQYVKANINLDELLLRIDINELGSCLYYEYIFDRLIYLERFDDATFLRLNYIVSSNPVQYYIYRALTCIKMKYDNIALYYFKKALEFESEDGGLYRYIAEYYEHILGFCPDAEFENAYNSAIDCYSYKLRGNNMSTFDLLLRAICYQGINEYGLAIEDLSKRIKIGEDKVPQYFIDRASCYECWHQYDNAVQDYRKAIEICHEDSNRHTYKYSYRYDDKAYRDLLALCYEKIGEKEKAKNAYLEAIQYYTNRIEKYNHVEDYAIRADCYERIGNYTKAIEDYTSAIEYVNSGVFYFICRANCYKEMGKYEHAIEDYKKALVNESESIETIIDIQYELNDLAEITSTPIKIFDNPEVIMQVIKRPFDDYGEDDEEPYVDETEEYIEDDDYDDDYDESDDDYNEEYEDEEYNSDECKEHMNSAIKYLLEEHKAKKAIVEIYKAYELDREFVSTLVNEILKSDFPTEIKIIFSSALDLCKQGEDEGMSSEEISQKLEQIFNVENNIDVSKLHYNPKQGRKLDL